MDIGFHVIDDPSAGIPFDGLIGQDIKSATKATTRNDNMTLIFETINGTLPLFQSFAIKPYSKTILTIEATEESDEEGVIQNLEDIQLPKEVTIIDSFISKKNSHVIATNQSNEEKFIALPRVQIRQPQEIFTIKPTGRDP